MATYVFMAASGSATAATDRGVIGVGIMNNGGAGINPTNLAYGFYAVDATGRIWTMGAAISSAAYTPGSTKGVLALAVATGGATSLGASGMNPLFVDLQGNLRVTASAALPVGITGTAFIQGSATVSGNVTANQTAIWGVTSSATTASQNGVVWGVTASAVTASANVDGDAYAVNTTRGRVVFALATAAPLVYTGSAMRPLQVDLNGNLRITATANWPVSLVATTVTASQNGVIWGVTASAVTAAISSGTVTLASGSVAAITANAGTPIGVVVSTATGAGTVLIVSANTARKAVIITNNAAGNLYLGHTTGVTTASATMGLLVSAQGGVYADSGWGLYTGHIYGVYSTASTTHNVSYSERS